MVWFKGKFTGNRVILPSNVGVSGFNLPIIQFYDTIICASSSTILKTSKSTVQGPPCPHGPWCLDCPTNGVEDERINEDGEDPLEL